jgi:hypothetical protein
VNEHGTHPVLSQGVRVPFGRGATVDQNTLCSLSCMQNEFLHNILHVKIHGLLDIDIELYLGNDSEDGDDYSNIIRELLIDELDTHDQRIFHAIERTMESDTICALFSKHNKILCNTILSDLDTWLCSKFIDTNNNVSFSRSAAVHNFTSTIDQRKTRNQVKFNAYASRIAKIFCSGNPNEAVESVYTALMMYKYRLCLRESHFISFARTIYNTPLRPRTYVHFNSCPGSNLSLVR